MLIVFVHVWIFIDLLSLPSNTISANHFRDPSGLIDFAFSLSKRSRSI